MNHPWMTKGFNGPPDNYLPSRKPLQLPLDSSVVAKMTGFDFGAADVITAQLTRIIDSEDYQRAVRLAEKRIPQQAPEIERKRGVFDFYKRRNSISSRDTLNTPSSEAIQLGQDPINAFHPLISIYYLAQEKQEREAREKNPGALSLPTEPGEKPLDITGLPTAPEKAYTNTHTAEMTGEKPTGGRSRPRARTQGEDEIADGVQNLNVNTAPNPTIVEPEQRPAQPQRRESGAVGLLRRLSTRKTKEPTDRERPSERPERPSHPPSSLAAYSNAETPKRSFSMRRSRDRDASATRARPESAEAAPSELLAAPTVGDGSVDKPPKRSHGLGRSISVNSSDVRRRLTRRGVSEGSSMRPPPSMSNYDRDASAIEHSRTAEEAVSDVETSTSRPTAGLASRARSMGHARKESMQARRMRRDMIRTSDVPEETDAELQDDLGNTSADGGSPTSGMKPVYLKGLFSVSTTSSRPLALIRHDIIRVLDQIGVEYREIRGGFTCKHTPSISPQPPADEQIAPSGAVLSSQQQPQPRKTSFSRYNRPTTNDPSDYDSEDDPAALAPLSSNPTRPLQQPLSSPRGPGETSTHVQSDLASNNNSLLRFEILIVKVPLLSLHGIQFKKVDGGTWQYKNMAQTILRELRL